MQIHWGLQHAPCSAKHNEKIKRKSHQIKADIARQSNLGTKLVPLLHVYPSAALFTHTTHTHRRIRARVRTEDRQTDRHTDTRTDGPGFVALVLCELASMNLLRQLQLRVLCMPTPESTDDPDRPTDQPVVRFDGFAT